MFGRRQTGEEGHFPSMTPDFARLIPGTYVRKINVNAKKAVAIDMNDEEPDGTSPTKTALAAKAAQAAKATVRSHPTDSTSH